MNEITSVKFLSAFTKNCEKLNLTNLFYVILLQIPSIYNNNEDINNSLLMLNMSIDYIIKNISSTSNLICNDLNKYLNHTSYIGTHAFQLAYMGINNVELLKKISTVHRKICPKINYISNFTVNKNTNRKIRIAFFSNLLKQDHSVANIDLKIKI